MRLPSFKRIWATDFPKEFQKSADILGSLLNYGIEILYTTLSNNITLQDNIKCTVKDIIVTVDVNGTPVQTTQLRLNQTGKLEGLTVLNAVNSTDNTIFPSSCPFLSWSQNDTVVTITNIKGLQANNIYTLHVVGFQQ